MNTIMQSLKTFISHNQGIVISFLLVCVLSLWFFGCQSKTQSIIQPGLKVTESVLNIEYTSELARLESELATLRSTTEVRLQDLHRQDIFKQALYQNAVLVAEGANPNPLGLLSLLGSIFGVGAIIDNRRKDGVIKGLKSGP